MALRTILDLPEIYIDERNEVQRLTQLGNSRTTTGNIIYVSGTSGITHNTVGTIYANQGEDGMLSLLYGGDVSVPSNPKMYDYMFVGSDITAIQQALDDSTVGSLTTLTTDDKSSCVNAINSVHSMVIDANLDTSKALAELLMIADIDNKVFSPNLGKFYTNFTSSMDYSLGTIDAKIFKHIGVLSVGSNSITLVTTPTFLVGEEISIQSESNYENIIVLSVVGNVLNFKTPTQFAHTNPSLYRSGVSGQAFGTNLTSENTSPQSTTFDSDGNFTVPAGVTQVRAIIIAGGGSGGGSGTNVYGTGGGGAGGLRDILGIAVTPNAVMPVVVGNGGAIASAAGNKGGDSSFAGYVSSGGGEGGENYYTAGANGGSGGGGFGGRSSEGSSAGGISSPVTSPIQGYAGGAGYNSTNAVTRGGGGGGAGGAGQAGTSSVSGAGGVGVTIDGVLYCSGGYGANGGSTPSVKGGGGSHNASGQSGRVILKYDQFMPATGLKNIVRFTITPYQEISEISAFLTKAEMSGFTVTAHISCVGIGQDEVYVPMVLSSTTDLGSTEELAFIKSGLTPNKRVTLKLELNRASTADNVSFTKLLGGVS